MKLIFAGTPDFAVPSLEALIASHHVVAVYTQPDRPSGRGKKMLASPVKQLALQNNIPVIQPTTLKTEVARIKDLQPDVIVVVAYGMLLPQSILDIPQHGCINVHGSILPKWRGAAPIQRAIAAGDEETGVSIMQMEAGLDTGPVYEILKTPIKVSDTSASIHDRLSKLGADGLISVLNKLSKNPELTPTIQAHQSATYAKKITKAESDIDWSNSAASIDQKIRAFIPWPICQTWHRGTRIRIWQAQVSQSNNNAQPGTILQSGEEGIEIACGSGSLMLLRIQRDGAKALDCREFLNGYAIKAGEHLEQTNPYAVKPSA
jgi:methionyl-tRNA formyltransferase